MRLQHDIIALALALLAGLIGTAQAAETWLRIDDPDQALRARLPAEAIDYGSFIWMPEQALPAAARGSRRVHRIEQPFDLPIDGRPTDLASLAPSGRGLAGSGEPGFHLVQFRGPVKNAWLAQLRARGLEPVQFIAPHAYLVWGRANQLPPATHPASTPVRFAGRLPDRARRMPGIAAHEHARAMIYRPAAAEVLAALRESGAIIRDWRPVGGEFLVVDLKIAPERYPDLLAIAGVLSVQQVTQDAGPRGELANQSVVGLADPNETLVPGYRNWLDFIGLDGNGVTVAVVDAGIRQTHQDLAGQFADCIPGLDLPSSCSQANDDHGTHVAGAIVGNGASESADAAGFLRGLGMAPGARVVQQHYPPLLGSGPGGMLPGGMLTIFAESALSGAVLANNSWGPSSTPQGYDIPSREVDLITRNALPGADAAAPILPVWSIMNGSGDNPDSVCGPSSLGAPDEAKNLLAVGSTALQGSPRNLQDLSANSAHGPACDDRLVPQIVAPGCSTDSTTADSDNSHSLSCGTSMASPIVTGAAALFVEQYRRDHDDRTPSPALIKAWLTASARNLEGFRDADGDLLGHRPDRKQGWGRLDAAAALDPAHPVYLLDQTRIFSATGQAWTGRFEPVDASAPMQIMLAWTDAPGHGLGGALPAWVNDLDLIVHHADDAYYGNGFGSDGFSTTGTVPDPANNLEGVVLAADQHQGEPVRIEVLAANLAADAIDPWTPGEPAQDFALVCVNCQQAPDFTLDLVPQSFRACVDDGPLLAEATVRSVLGFDEPVGLSAQALDDFGGSIDLPGTAQTPVFTQTLEIDPTGASAGAYRVRVEAESATAGSIASMLALGVDAPLTTGPDALAPSAMEPVPIASGFAWTALDGAEQYRFELATDADFSQLVESRLVEDPAWQPRQWLDPETTYYWRVRGLNACGEGVISETFSLQTDAGPAAALAFLNPPEPDGEGGFVAPVQVEIRNANGQRISGDDRSVIELSLAAAADGTTLTGTLSRQVVGGVASFDDLGISAESDDEFRLRARLIADEMLALGDFELNTRDAAVQQHPAGLTSASPVTGLAFSGTVSGISGSASFASDLRLVTTSPEGTSASLGGFETASDKPWDFDGETSAGDGSYQSEHPVVFSDQGSAVVDEGFWQFEFRNDFSGGQLMQWSDVEIRLIKPALETVSGTIPVRGSRIFQDRFEHN
ncbi:MAG: S8 family serine peptidase [Wenzhouxiangella sp.]